MVATMILNVRRQVFILGICLLASAAYGVNTDPDERNYRIIVERNPFGIKPPPPPPTNTPPPVVQPKDKILLTGITSIGALRAYFMTEAPANKQAEYYSLGVDEKKDDLEVIGIDPVARSVRVRNSGVESVMTFAANGVKPPAGAAAPPPGMPGAPTALPTPGAGALPGVNPVTGAVTMPGSRAQAINPATGSPMGVPAAPGSGRIRTIPSRNIRTPAAMAPAVNANIPPPPPDPNAGVEDILMMELQKRANPHIEFPPTPGLPTP
jgi:hypothetical protein